KATIGTDIALKNVTLNVEDRKIRAQIVLWDLAGQPTYRDLRQRYMVGASMAFIVYDVTRPPTYLNVDDWYRNFRLACPNAVVAIVANKIDRTDRLVPPEAGKMLKEWLNVMYIETSAKEGTNVNRLFTEVATKAVVNELKRNGKLV
ncbi:GTP-binding protein, partial [Candidatus Thorarchaeota archaeon]